MTSTAKSKGQSAGAGSYVWDMPANTTAQVSVGGLVGLLLGQFGIGKSESELYFSPDYTVSLHDAARLGGVERAVERIKLAVDSGEQIIVYGDYDIDGLSATALMIDILTQIGANASPYIPDRFEEGYGINLTALKGIKSQGAGLVISVDCGITSANEVSQARQLGLDIIVTDHHSVPAELPDQAVACLNPRQPTDKYPFKELAGVGVAFKLACALAKAYPEKVPPGQEKWLLDLVALGTVCDVVPLVGENRALVQFGLKVMQKSPRKGLRALAETSGVELSNVSASDLGFRFGPRLNAAGRLEHAAKALELLMTSDSPRAKELADGLSALNRERQEDTTRVFAEAMAQAEEHPDDAILVLSDPSWSHGIVGLVASRVSEAFHKPTIILQELGEVSKGSARSIGAFNIIDAVTDSASLLARFGGHAFAAGMTLKTKDISKLRSNLNQYAAGHKGELSGGKKLAVSALLAPSLLTASTLKALSKLEPYGNGNLQPVFVSQLKLTRLRPVGSDQKHLQMSFEGEAGETLGAIAFGATGRWPWPDVGNTVDVAYRLSGNVWQGVERLQLEVVDLRSL